MPVDVEATTSALILPDNESLVVRVLNQEAEEKETRNNTQDILFWKLFYHNIRF